MISRYTLNKFEIHISLIKCKKKIQFCTRVILAIKSIQARRYDEKIKKCKGKLLSVDADYGIT